MPLIEGSTVATAADGQAEIEFTDGSVARLTPNSSLQIARLMRAPSAGTSSAAPRTELALLSGLGYFELNSGRGQTFTVLAAQARLRANDAIFRVGLDDAPELAVFQGSVVKSSGPGERARVAAGESLPLDQTENGVGNGAVDQIAEGFTPDSWDQWNLDRDQAIAQEASAQTDVRDAEPDANDPGWNDLDANGSWYSVDGYGNVWTPNAGADWDPFGDGYWGQYPGYGLVWISAYSWGWLPYHCGAWNYFSFGWGWVPGGCGVVWSPVVTVWERPPNYRLPAMPMPNPHLGIVPSQQRRPIAAPPFSGRLVAVHRGGNAAFGASSAVRYNGRMLQPKPMTYNNAAINVANNAAGTRGHLPVGVPARIGAVSAVGGRLEIHRQVPLDPNVYGPMPGESATRPVGRAAYTPRPASPRLAPPVAGPAPAPRVSAPAAPAPHFSPPAAPPIHAH
jgi:hypothetical protein